MARGNRTNHLKKQFCVNGHDMSIVGRTKWGKCTECAKYKPVIVDRRKGKIQFCPKGHDTFVTGRSGTTCNVCVTEKFLSTYISHPKQSARFCSKGHDKEITGKSQNGSCTECKKERDQKRWERSKEDSFHIEIQSQFCPNGHDKNIVGRTKLGSCAKCRIEYPRKRRSFDLNFKLACNLRSRLGAVLKNNQKRGSAIKDLGCSVDFLKSYLESLWLFGMSWSNYGKGKGKWNIDHILALANFDLTDPIQFKEACHYTNLQPLWEPDNIRKSNKI